VLLVLLLPLLLHAITKVIATQRKDALTH